MHEISIRRFPSGVTYVEVYDTEEEEYYLSGIDLVKRLYPARRRANLHVCKELKERSQILHLCEFIAVDAKLTSSLLRKLRTSHFVEVSEVVGGLEELRGKTQTLLTTKKNAAEMLAFLKSMYAPRLSNEGVLVEVEVEDKVDASFGGRLTALLDEYASCKIEEGLPFMRVVSKLYVSMKTAIQEFEEAVKEDEVSYKAFKSLIR